LTSEITAVTDLDKRVELSPIDRLPVKFVSSVTASSDSSMCPLILRKHILRSQPGNPIDPNTLVSLRNCRRVGVTAHPSGESDDKQ
jgi:hypothetical protein